MRDHRQLETFGLADELAMATYSATRHFPKHERYGLVSQMRRSAISIPTNIVEGCGRRSEAELLRFLDIAFSSTRELSYLIDLSTRLGYTSAEDADRLTGLHRRTAAALAALMRSFGPTRTRKERPRPSIP